MPAIPAVKKPDDFVKVVNISKEILIYSYDGNSHTMAPGEEEMVLRACAERGVAQTAAFEGGVKKNRLTLFELPETLRQVSPGKYPQLADEVKALQEKMEELEEDKVLLAKTNSQLKAEIEQQSQLIAELRGKGQPASTPPAAGSGDPDKPKRRKGK